MSGKHAERADAAWRAAGLNRITLHECRHTDASLLMAAGYTIKELMEFMGHADLQMVNRYVNSCRSRARTTPRRDSTTTFAVLKPSIAIQHGKGEREAPARGRGAAHCSHDRAR